MLPDSIYFMKITLLRRFPRWKATPQYSCFVFPCRIVYFPAIKLKRIYVSNLGRAGKG